MFFQVTYRLRILLPVALLLLLSGCYKMTIRVASVPANTPPTESLYISGNFNNWDPGDPAYILRKNKDSVYEVSLPRGFGDVEYKFTRGDWSTVEKDQCGFEISNRVAYYGKDTLMIDSIRSWNDLPKPGCPSIVLVIDSVPKNTPADAVLYMAANFNGWDPGSRYWMFSFSQGLDGKYYIDVPRVNNDKIYYKITRGDWRTVECAPNGDDIENRVLEGRPGQEVRIKVQRWKDK